MDSTTARQRRGTAKPSMKKKCTVLLALATGSATGQGAAPPALRCFISLQIAIFRGALPWGPDFCLLLEKRKRPCGFY